MNFAIQYKLRVMNSNFISFQVKIIISFVILHRKYVYASSNQFARSHIALQNGSFTLNLSDMITKPILGTPEHTHKEGK